MKTPVLISIMIITFSSDYVNNTVTVNDGYQIGDVVSDFELKNVDGQMVSMSDYKDA